MPRPEPVLRFPIEVVIDRPVEIVERAARSGSREYRWTADQGESTDEDITWEDAAWQSGALEVMEGKRQANCPP